jgi:uncharacterized protein (TIGR00255 family)
MTGFGSASSEADGLSARVEIRAVNQRGLRCSVRSRPSLGALEKKLRDALTNSVKRGQIDINVELIRLTADPSALVNAGVASGAIEALRTLQNEHNLPGEVTLAEVVRVPGVFDAGQNTTVEEDEYAVIASALQAALSQLKEMREVEGQATREVLARHAESIEAFRVLAADQAPKVIERTRERLTARLADLSPAAADTQALEREVAFFADRADINEELDRLTSHISQFRSTLSQGGEVGKRLEFLAQEMLREVNTTASKANDTEIAAASVEAKLAIEKIKEQAANIE